MPNEKLSSHVRVVDLFCGIGGLTHGFVREGFDVVAGYDLDESCRYAYEANNNGASFISKDIKSVTAEELNTLYGDAKYKVLVGCAPCQPFSNHTQKTRKENQGNFKGDDYQLILEFVRLVEEVKPDFISMENVPQLERFQGDDEVLGLFKRRLAAAGYSEPTIKIVYCPDYGIPQHRKRLVLLASRQGKIDLLPATHDPSNYVTVKQALKTVSRWMLRDDGGRDPLHTTTHLTEVNLKRIRASRPGGTWKDWPVELLPTCYTKKSGESYKSVYGRMRDDQPAPTITTQFYNYGTGRFGHPTEDRALTVREAALLQSFPLGYKIVPKGGIVSLSKVGRHIGNAVPVGLGEVIAKSIEYFLNRITN